MNDFVLISMDGDVREGMSSCSFYYGEYLNKLFENNDDET
jgi:hypothetical protein